MSTNSSVADLISLAAEQRGLVTSRQAREVASVTPQKLRRLADRGVLEHFHHGLYRLARVPHDEHLEMRVAWFALDQGTVAWQRLNQDVPTGVLSHRTAADLHRLGDVDADVVEMTAPRRIRLTLPDVAIHRGELTRDDWQIIDELPVTTPLRTISDLAAASLDSGHLAAIVRDALTRTLLTADEATEALAPHAFSYGYRALDGSSFLDALIEQAGVPLNTLEVADIVRTSQNSELWKSMQQAAAAVESIQRNFKQVSSPAAESMRAITAQNSELWKSMQQAGAAVESFQRNFEQVSSPAVESMRAITAQNSEAWKSIQQAAAAAESFRSSLAQVSSPAVESMRAISAQNSEAWKSTQQAAAAAAAAVESIDPATWDAIKRAT